MKDGLGRQITYMRISVTDRCNLRCRYCMPEELESISHDDILRFEEILRICRCAAGAGIRNFKVTGGEPLVRKGCLSLLRDLKKLAAVQAVTLTTNGVLLGDYLEELKAIGIDGINISMDTLDRHRYKALTGRDESSRVWNGFLAAVQTGIPVKINCVPIRDFNEDELPDFIRLAEQYRTDIRFIEMMPIGHGKHMQGLDSREVLDLAEKQCPGLERDLTVRGCGPADYYKSPSMQGSIGVIGSVHHKFCDSCNRIRLTSEGFLKTCLYYDEGVDLRGPLRSGAADSQLTKLIMDAVTEKPAGHRFGETDERMEYRGMSRIGG